MQITMRNGRLDAMAATKTLPVVRQIIKQVQDDLRALGGNYTWSIDEDDDKRMDEHGQAYRVLAYSVIARSREGAWVEGHGRTPWRAVMDSQLMRTVLLAKGFSR